jgi:hypothetical protein
MADVLPLFQAKIGGTDDEGVVLHVAGSGAPPGHLQVLFDRHRRTINFHGYLPDAEVCPLCSLWHIHTSLPAAAAAAHTQAP